MHDKTDLYHTMEVGTCNLHANGRVRRIINEPQPLSSKTPNAKMAQ